MPPSDTPLDTAVRALSEMGALDIVFRVTVTGVSGAAYYRASDTMQCAVGVDCPTADECVVELARKLVARKAGTP